MANTYFPNQFQYTKEHMVSELYAIVTFGASGAPTLSQAKGITSIVRASAGLYTITLANNYNRLLDVSTMIQAGGSAAAAPILTMVSQAVSNATPTVVLQFRAIDNSTATDPASGEILRLSITLCNSSV